MYVTIATLPAWSKGINIYLDFLTAVAPLSTITEQDSELVPLAASTIWDITNTNDITLLHGNGDISPTCK